MEPRTLEIFSELVRSGVIRPHDLVFDALTGEWVPAEAHPMVRLLQDPLVLDPMARSLDVRLAEAAGEVPLALVEEPPVDPEEEAEAFIRKMEEERRGEPTAPLEGMVVPLEPERPLMAEKVMAPPPVEEAPVPRPDRVDTEFPSPGAESGKELLVSRGWRRRWSAAPWLMAAGVVGVVGAVGVARAGGGGEGPVEGTVRAVAARAVADSEDDIRRVAREGFLRAVEEERTNRGLGDAPGIWLDGRYLAGAAAYEEVPRYWEEARAFARDVRSREVDLFRVAYLEAAESAGLSGPVRSLRLAAALEDFAASASRRAAAYEGMTELAEAAVGLHEILVELGDRVTYEPVRGGRVSADPVLEAAGSDLEAQTLLEASLDRVLRALHGAGGAPVADRSQVSGWLTQALEGALTPG